MYSRSMEGVSFRMRKTFSKSARCISEPGKRIIDFGDCIGRTRIIFIRSIMKTYIASISLLLSAFASQAAAAELRVLTNHLGYEIHGPKHAVVLGGPGVAVSACSLN